MSPTSPSSGDREAARTASAGGQPHQSVLRGSGSDRGGGLNQQDRGGVVEPPLSLTERELFDRLGWFIGLRWIAGVVAFLFLFFGREVFDVEIPVGPVLATIFVLFFYNACFLLLVRAAQRRGHVRRRFIFATANAQLVCDLVALTVLIHFTGGVENYFIVAFVFPMVIASELLSRVNAYVHATLGAVLVHAMAWGEYFGVLSHVHLREVVGAELYLSSVFVLKATMAVSVALFVSVFLGSSIAARLRFREEQLEEAHARLRAVDEMKSLYMRRVSHELQAPLNVVVTCLRLVLDGIVGRVDEKIYHLFERAEQRTVALVELIRDLRRYAALRDATSLMRTEPVNLQRIVQETADLLAEAAEKKNLTVVVDASAAVPTVLGDREALTEVCSNLLSNAIRYTPAGGRVEASLAPVAQGVVLRVRDTGIGIPPESLPRIFEEFYRAPNAREAEPGGTGMGLAIVKRIVELHGGSVAIDSTQGQGTTVQVILPASPSSYVD